MSEHTSVIILDIPHTALAAGSFDLFTEYSEHCTTECHPAFILCKPLLLDAMRDSTFSNLALDACEWLV